MSNSNETKTIKDMGDEIKAILDGRNKTIADYDAKIEKISQVISAAGTELDKLSKTYDTNKQLYERLKAIWIQDRTTAEAEVARLNARLESKKQETADKLAALNQQKEDLEKKMSRHENSRSNNYFIDN